MRNTHILTHKSGHLFASSLLFFLVTVTVGGSLICFSNASIIFSSVLKYTAAGADAFLLSCNRTYFTYIETLTAGVSSPYHVGVENAGNHQPHSVQQLFVNQPLIGKAVRLDAAFMLQRPVPGRVLGGAKRGNTGQRRLVSASKAENSVLGIDDGGVVTVCPRSQNPQSELSQGHLSGTLLGFVVDLSAEAFSIDSQVLRVTKA